MSELLGYIVDKPACHSCGATFTIMVYDDTSPREWSACPVCRENTPELARRVESAIESFKRIE
jgi:hypothetical protein